jgi:hypothetical protein
MCSAEIEPDGPWRWRCIVENGVRTPIIATLEERFLRLEGSPKAMLEGSRALKAALMGTDTLAGGVKLALDASGSGLQIRTDIVLLDETQLLDRICWALAGFHDSSYQQEFHGSQKDRLVTPATAAATGNLGELLHETSWQCTERDLYEFSVNLDADSAPPARISRNERGLVFSVELCRCYAEADVSWLALAVFLLTACSSLRLVRANTTDVGAQLCFGFQVCLPAAPVAEEINHALAALSVAYRMCAREANALLDEATARCYLSARDLPTNNNHEQHKEN